MPLNSTQTTVSESMHGRRETHLQDGWILVAERDFQSLFSH
jgi:hypothetical protein